MIADRIRKSILEMPQNFQKIGSYILDHEQSVAFSSIHAVSKAIGVSSASLVRFAKSLGFEGYQDFKKEIQSEMRHRLNPYDKIALSELGSLPEEKRLQKLFQNEYNNLRNTFANIDIQDLKDIAEAIRGKRKVYVGGFGATSYMVRIFEYTLMSSLDRDVSVICGSVSDYAPVLKSFGPEDVMFLMTFPPYSAEVRHVARVAKERKGRLYLFTDSASCPVYPLADKVIRCTTNSLLLSNSFVGLVSVLHVLVQMLYLEEKNLAVESRQKTFEIQEQGYAIMEGLTGQHRDSPRE